MDPKHPTEHGSAPAAADEQSQPEDGGGEPRRIDWALVVEVAGLGAALAAWVAVVGGGRVWARLEAAEVPALPTLAGLGQEWFIAEGLQTLLLPILLGGVVALLVYYSAPLNRPSPMPESRADEAAAESGSSAATGPARLAHGARAPHTWSRRVFRPRPDEPASHRATGSDGLAVPHTWARRRRPSSRPAFRQRAAESVRRSPPVSTSVRAWNRLRRIRQIAAVSDAFSRDPEYVGVLAIAVPALLLIVTVLIADVSYWLLLGFIGLALVAAVLGARSGWPDERLILIPLSILLLGILVTLLVAVEFFWLLVMAAITLVAAWITLGALVAKGAGRFALTLFIAVAVWSGALGLVKERGARDVELAHAVVYLKEAESVGGYYLGRSSDRVYVARDPNPVREGDDADREVVVLENDDVDRVVITNDRPVPEDGGKQPPGDGEGLPEGGGGPGDEPEEPETEDDTESPLPPSDLQPDVPVEAKEGEIGSQVIEFQVLALTRRPGFVELDARVMNRSPDPLRIGGAFGRRGDPSLDGIELFDPRGERTYETARRDDGSCLCDENLDQVELQPDESLRLSTVFELSPPVGTEFDLRVPSVGWIRGVPVT